MYCEELIAATEFARVTTLLCLLLTVVGVFGLSPPAQPGRGGQKRKISAFSIILAVGGMWPCWGGDCSQAKHDLEDLDTDGSKTPTPARPAGAVALLWPHSGRRRGGRGPVTEVREHRRATPWRRHQARRSARGASISPAVQSSSASVAWPRLAASASYVS